MAKVWIVNRSGHDYSAAERFGDLNSLSIGSFLSPLQVDRVLWEFSRGIAKYATEDDYLLLSGNVLHNAVALVVWLERFGSCRLLIFKPSERNYELRLLSAEQIRRTLSGAAA